MAWLRPCDAPMIRIVGVASHAEVMGTSTISLLIDEGLGAGPPADEGNGAQPGHQP